ncbi:hypothetical protein KC351_g93 [Hortaea werneckii]|nr:hypothetical protein KC351_g93 [Hortaea werneckii]
MAGASQSSHEKHVAGRYWPSGGADAVRPAEARDYSTEVTALVPIAAEVVLKEERKQRGGPFPRCRLAGRAGLKPNRPPRRWFESQVAGAHNELMSNMPNVSDFCIYLHIHRSLWIARSAALALGHFAVGTCSAFAGSQSQGLPDGFGSIAILDPVYDPHQYIMLGIIRCIRSATGTLPDLPCTFATAAVAHAADAEEAIEVIKFTRRHTHGGDDMLVVPW